MVGSVESRTPWRVSDPGGRGLMSTAGKVLVVLVMLFALVWMILAGGVAQLNRTATSARGAGDRTREGPGGPGDGQARGRRAARPDDPGPGEDRPRRRRAHAQIKPIWRRTRRRSWNTLARVNYRARHGGRQPSRMAKTAVAEPHRGAPGRREGDGRPEDRSPGAHGRQQGADEPAQVAPGRVPEDLSQ